MKDVLRCEKPRGAAKELRSADIRMGKPTFDSGILKCLGVKPRAFWISAIKRRYETPEYIGGFKRTGGTETSQYPEERTSTETPLVVASERGPGQWRM